MQHSQTRASEGPQRGRPWRRGAKSTLATLATLTMVFTGMTAVAPATAAAVAPSGASAVGGQPVTAGLGDAVRAFAGDPSALNAPGNPGVPSDPVVVFEEDFEHVDGMDPVLRLTDYTGENGQQYTADAPWLRDCNGWIAAFAQNTDAEAQIADCGGQQQSWNNTQQLAHALGQHAGAADVTANFAVSAYTAGSPGADFVEFETAGNIDFSAANRFITFGVDVAAVSCQAAHPLLQFSLLNENGDPTAVGAPIDGCQSDESVSVPGLGVAGEQTMQVGTYTSDGATLFAGSSVGIRMVNEEGSGAGNDHAFDNIRILDVTPQLDKSFSPTSLPVGDSSTLTLTVTNTSELAAKNGWGFTDALPAGLEVAAPANLAGTCTADVTAAAGDTSIVVADGQLPAGTQSCTITVDVTSDTAGSYTNGPDNIEGEIGIDLPDESTVAFHEADFGDAPNSFGTTRAADGPRHGLPGYDAGASTATAMLGASVTAETDGQPGAAADGDTGDDGVAFNPGLDYASPTLRTGLDRVSRQPVDNALEVTASADGFVSVWVDWDLDGSFDESERVVNATAVSAGANTLTFSQGENPTGIETFVRVRYSTEASAIASATGSAPDGEVEDYRVFVERLITPDACLASADEHYSFSFSSIADATGTGGPGSSIRYTNVSVIDGTPVDMLAEVTAGMLNSTTGTAGNGFTHTAVGANSVLGAQTAGWYVNRDVTIRYTFVEAGTTTPIAINGVFMVNDLDGPPAASESMRFSADDLAAYAVTAGSAVQVSEEDGFVTFAGDGDWDGELQSRFQIVLEDISSFEVRSQGGQTTGLGFNGNGSLDIEPADCFDFGDAPESYGTLLDDDGPRHAIVSGLLLGSLIDFEDDGQPTAAANGDDEAGLSDEEGVTEQIVVTIGDETTVSVSATNDTAEAATLAGWIDLNGDGAFDADERVVVAVPAGSGEAEYELTFPAGSVTDDTFARFRLFGDEVADPQPTGAATAGEVEDYPVTVIERALEIEKTSDATAETRVGDVVSYTVSAMNIGTADYTAATPAIVLDDLAGVLDDGQLVGDVTATVDGDPAGTVSVDGALLGWTGPLAAGATVEITYDVVLTAGGDGLVRNVAFASDCDPADPACDVETPDCAADDPTCDEEVFELPRLTIEKSADRAEIPAVGETVEYTVTVRNEGPGDYTADAPATFEDDMTDVLDDADYNGDATATIGTVDFTSPILGWDGVLAAGEEAVVTYTVTYTAEGDLDLRNTVCIPASETLPGTSSCDFVEVPGAGLTQWKQVLSSDSPAVAGSVLTYTLFFKNDGQAAASVDAVDHLVHVLDDADVTGEPTAQAGLVAERDGDRISITGSVPAGETLTITYQVTLRADGERGDDRAVNFLLDSEEEPPGGDPVCVPADGQFPDCTTTPIGAVTYVKSVAADGAPIEEGSVLTYTITVTGSGAADAPVAREDVLTGVLDDADLTSAPVSDTDSVTVSEVVDGRFHIGGTIGAGQTATVTYEVTVRAQDERGDNRADNFLVPPGGDPSEECVDGSPECTTTGLPHIVVDKSVDPVSGTTVLPGQEVTYTLTFANTGEGSGSLDYTDDLAGVLDDAVLTAGPTASDDALTAELGSDETLAIAGILDGGQTVVVVYTVTVLPDEQRGDHVLGNVLFETGTEPDCETDGVICTENPVPALESWKSVEADSAPVAAGTVLTYTLHFENSGAAPAIVDEIDDLTHVTDDADVTVEPVSDDLEVARDGNRISITGEVPAGETRTVEYQVTVRADGERGDDIATNFLMPNDPENPPTTPENVCQPTDGERPDCTTTPIGRLLTGKSVSADTDPVDTGTVLTYTLTFDNQGEGPVVIDHTDHLVDVLDDADLTTTPTASDEALIVSDVIDDAFTVSGTLDAGQTETVTYQVTVKAPADRGNDVANNFLVRSGEEPQAECDEVDPNCTTTNLPRIVPDKTADPVSGTDVQAGQEITYTLTFTNVGLAAGPVDHLDDLSGVLDDAVLTVTAVSSDPALVASSGTDGAVRVTGMLEAGQTVTVTYTVTVNPDGERGDNVLRNVLAPSDIDGDELVCGEDGVVCTEHPAGELDDWKTVDPASGSTVQPGQDVTYTLHFENVGEAPVTVDREDVLTDVLDDATVTTQPVASDDALAVSEIADGRFAVAGELEPGQLVTVTYTVTVNPDGERGDDRLGNVLVPAGAEPPAECAPVDPERADCTVNHVSNVVAAKSADPVSGTEVGEERAVTYTLTFENVSTNAAAAPAEFDYTDHLVDVLDDAELTGGPESSTDTVTAEVEGDTIRVIGSLAAGEVATVTYTVTTKVWEQQGDHHLGNVVAITGEVPVCAPESNLCTDHPLTEDPPLAATGADIAWMSVWTALALLLGGGVLLIARRHRAQRTENTADVMLS